MSNYDNTNRGALFRNEDRKADSHPEYTGQINVEGNEYWLSAWVNTAKSGKKYFSLTIRGKEDKPKYENDGGTDSNGIPF